MNIVQKLYSDLLRLSSFNNLDATEVADWLEANPDKWRAFMFGRFHYSPLITLRDLPDGINNADTLFVLCPTPEAAKTILAIADANWCADEFDIVENAGQELGTTHPNGTLVRVWWD